MIADDEEHDRIDEREGSVGVNDFSPFDLLVYHNRSYVEEAIHFYEKIIIFLIF